MYVYVNNTLTPTVITVPLVIPGPPSSLFPSSFLAHRHHCSPHHSWPTVITVPLIIPGENLDPLITTLKLQSNTLQYSDWYTGR